MFALGKAAASRSSGRDRARSTGATVVARSSGKDIITRGGTGPLVTPKSPLVVR